MPTTGVAQVTGDQFPKIANKAMLDIYAAIGFGLVPVLVVRDFDYHIINAPPNGNKRGNGQKYFTNPIKDTTLEPAFWGGIEGTPNINLGDYYIGHLNRIREFLELPVEHRVEYMQTHFTPEISEAFIKEYMPV